VSCTHTHHHHHHTVSLCGLKPAFHDTDILSSGDDRRENAGVFQLATGIGPNLRKSRVSDVSARMSVSESWNVGFSNARRSGFENRVSNCRGFSPQRVKLQL